MQAQNSCVVFLQIIMFGFLSDRKSFKCPEVLMVAQQLPHNKYTKCQVGIQIQTAEDAIWLTGKLGGATLLLTSSS